MDLVNREDYEELYQNLSNVYEQVNGYEFYRDLFPNNEDKGELNDDFSKPNAIFLYFDEEFNRMRRRIMLNDTWKDDYMSYVERNRITLCSGLSYRAMANKLNNAQKMHALIFDLDEVGTNEYINLFHRMTLPVDHPVALPLPTYVVMSGSGLHLYYIFKEPIDLYPNIKLQLKSLKYELTYQIWDPKTTSKHEKRQFQSINQSFRMVGSMNDKHNWEVTAFKTGEKVDLEYMNNFVKTKVDINKPFRPSQTTLEVAKEKYPEWYQRVVKEGNKNLKKWDIAGKVNGKDPWALYHWWKKRAEEAEGGHRYFFMMCMSIYACKCDVPKKQLKKDLYEVFEILKSKSHTNELTENDIESALETYSREYYNYTIEDIKKLSGLNIERNKRNYRKQEQHMEVMRAIQTVTNPNWREGNGRKSKEEIVKEWQLNNPNSKKADCIRETGLSKPTVYKWW